MTIEEKNLLYDRVYNYKSKSDYGLISTEIKDVLKDYPDCNMEKYNDAMMGNTGMFEDDKGFINYHCDVYSAILCGMENRDQMLQEWD
tara:strand:+ start:295 stop:558 length:264 start_codon:yes stop_codon:yes gene_type:complete